MRRRLDVFVPIMLLSILVQLSAPIAAFRAVAYAANDPLSMGLICSHTASSADEQQNSPANTQHDSEGRCAFCAVGHDGGVGYEPPPLIFVSMQRAYQRVAWLKAADQMLTVRFGSNTQARAPPPAA
jgi:hypothetical protein